MKLISAIFLYSFLFYSCSFHSPSEIMSPSTYSSLDTNYSIDDNNYKFLETMTITIETPRFFMSMTPMSMTSTSTQAFKDLKNAARNKYGNEVGFINVTVEDKIMSPVLWPLLPNPIYHTKITIVSADIIKYNN